VSERRPNRTMSGPHAEFWEHCRSGELHLQRCPACGEVFWPPVERCERCGGPIAWEPTSGLGTVTSWCTFEHRYYQELPVPWETILVELDEGPFFISNPHGFSCADATPEMRVQVVFIDCEDDFGPFFLPVFERSTEPLHHSRTRSDRVDLKGQSTTDNGN
jgi:uncharacterized OB-fold protein